MPSASCASSRKVLIYSAVQEVTTLVKGKGDENTF